MKAVKTNKHLDYFGYATDCIFFDESHCQGADERYCERSDRKGYDPNCKECEFYYDIEMARAMIENVQKFEGVGKEQENEHFN